MRKSYWELLRDIFRPRIVRVVALLVAGLTIYDPLSNQFGLPKLGTLWGVSGQLLPWWGWLLILEAVFVYALFEYIRSLPQVAVPDELDRLKNRISRAEERLDGAMVVSAVGHASGRGDASTLKLTLAERDRVSASLLKVKDYLEGDFRDGFAPIRQLLSWRKIIQREGAGRLHSIIEAPRPTMRQFIDEFAAAVKPYLDETNLLGINVMGIKTKALPLWDAVRNVSSITEVLQPEQRNPAPVELAAGEMSRVIGEIENEVDRALRDIADWRKRIAEGEI